MSEHHTMAKITLLLLLNSKSSSSSSPSSLSIVPENIFPGAHPETEQDAFYFYS
jgi:hypothetical protein